MPSLANVQTARLLAELKKREERERRRISSPVERRQDTLGPVRPPAPPPMAITDLMPTAASYGQMRDPFADLRTNLDAAKARAAQGRVERDTRPSRFGDPFHRMSVIPEVAEAQLAPMQDVVMGMGMGSIGGPKPVPSTATSLGALAQDVRGAISPSRVLGPTADDLAAQAASRLQGAPAAAAGDIADIQSRIATIESRSAGGASSEAERMVNEAELARLRGRLDELGGGRAVQPTDPRVMGTGPVEDLRSQVAPSVAAQAGDTGPVAPPPEGATLAEVAAPTKVAKPKAPPRVFDPASPARGASPRTIVAKVLRGDGKGNFGYTVDPVTGITPNTGVMVGKYANQSGRVVAVPVAKFTPKVVADFYAKNQKALAQGDSVAGFWWNKITPTNPTGDDLVYIELSKVEKTVRGATKTGEQQRMPKSVVRDPVTGAWPQAQKEVFNLKTKENKPVGNVTDFVNSDEFQTRLQTMYKAGQKVMEGRPDWWDIHGSSFERVYGREKLPQQAGFLGATSTQSGPVPNIRLASEYMRRFIKGEPQVQPGFRVPEGSVGFTPGKKMGSEATKGANLRKAAAGNLDAMQQDKVNDMVHALMGEDVGVYDRHYAKLAEDPKRGLFANRVANKLSPAMKTGRPELYAWIDNATRKGAATAGVPLKNFSATVWEGIRETIRTEGKLFGTKYDAGKIPATEGGFSDIFDQLIAEKAKKIGITVEALEQRLRSGDAELLGLVLSAPIGAYFFSKWQDRQKGPS